VAVTYTPVFETEVRAWAESLLSPDRLAHVRGVVATADKLARRFAPTERARVRLAGWIHDVAKAWDDDALLRYAETHDLPITPVERQVPALLHGAVAYALAAERFGLHDPVLAAACALHTTGAPGMPLAAKLVFVADIAEPGRDFKGVKRVRRAARWELDAALLAAVDAVIRRLVRKGRIIDPRGIALHNALILAGVPTFKHHAK
jgi:predicted HD superfamily hydrolase involved in NAD metabolism